MTPKYPDWDGTSQDRPQGINRSPSPSDWDQITAEVLKHQSILRTLLITIEIPNYTLVRPIVPEDDFEIIDIKVIKLEDQGGPNDFLVFKNGGSEITEHISLNIPKNRITRIENLDLNLTSLRIGSYLTIEARKDINCACKVFINCLIE